jgi:hypothetical protein
MTRQSITAPSSATIAEACVYRKPRPERRISNIVSNDAMILPCDANPGRMEFSERTGEQYPIFSSAFSNALL